MAKRKFIVSEGQKFNALTMIRETDPVKYGNHKIRMVLCECDCGNETTSRLDYVKSGHTKSCGCASNAALIAHRKTHGLPGTRLHGIWNGMKNRCYNENRKSFENYGAKGVRVCSEWHSFEAFHIWAIQNGYEEHLTIERKNPFGNYEPTNCTWIPREEQHKNKRIHHETAYV